MERLPDDIVAAVASAAGAAQFGPPAPLYTVLAPREAVCPEHGRYTSAGTRYTIGKGREVWTPCPGCAEQRKADEAAAADAERQARDKLRFEEMIGRAAIPDRFISRTFETYHADAPDQSRALATARDYAENFGQHAKTGESLLLLGRTGTGKSHLAAAILQAIMPAHCGMYATAADVIEMVRETWRRDSPQSQAAVLGMLARVPLLVIDEIGVQYGTESEQNTLFQVLDRRYRERKPFILLANLMPAELKALLGDRIFDRLREVSKSVLFEWDSYRSQARRDTP